MAAAGGTLFFFFFNLVLKIKKNLGGGVSIAITTSSLYFGVGGAVLNLSSSNSLRISMSTHGLHAAILGKNAFQFGILGPSHLTQLSLS